MVTYSETEKQLMGRLEAAEARIQEFQNYTSTRLTDIESASARTKATVDNLASTVDEIKDVSAKEFKTLETSIDGMKKSQKDSMSLLERTLTSTINEKKI